MAIVITPPDCHHSSFHFRSLTHWTYIGRTIRQTVSTFSAPETWSYWKLEGREDGALEVICSKIKDLVKEECQLSKKRPKVPGSPPGAALKYHIYRHRVCFFVLCNRRWFNRVPGPRQTRECLSTLHPYSDAGYADLPLTLLSAPVNIGEASSGLMAWA